MRLLSFAGATRPTAYALLAPVLLLVPHLTVTLLLTVRSTPLVTDAGFWLLPLRRLAMSPDMSASDAALAFAVALAATGALALLSFRRAHWSCGGYAFAAITVVPGVQIAAATVLALLPRFAR